MLNVMDATKSAEIDSNCKKRWTNRTCFVPKCTTGYKSNTEKKAYLCFTDMNKYSMKLAK